jgi:hypothetical protein
MTTTTSFTHLDDRSLLDTVKQLALEERRATATLLRALMEIDARQLYLGEGCASMFVYCTRVLGLSEGGAYNRIEVARAARRFPAILQLFEQGTVTLTAVRLLAPHLTPENHVAVLDAARHKSKREVELLVATLAPKPDAPTIVRKLPVREAATAGSMPLESGPISSLPDVGPTTGAAAVRIEPSEPPTVPTRVAPLAPDRYLIRVTVSRETRDKLRRAQALLRHAVPSGDEAAILDRALTLLVEHLERRRFAETCRPRPANARCGHSRHIPAAVRRAVWKRDAGQCAFIGAEGRCPETTFLEFHHVEPYAVGGPPSVDNVQLRCRSHNGYEARLFFGTDIVREGRAEWCVATSRE